MVDGRESKTTFVPLLQGGQDPQGRDRGKISEGKKGGGGKGRFALEWPKELSYPFLVNELVGEKSK